MYSEFDLDTILREAPMNLIFADSEALVKIVTGKEHAKKQRIVCLAELLIRWYLFDKCNTEDEKLKAIFHGTELRQLKNRLTSDCLTFPTGDCIQDFSWETDDDFLKSCEVAIRRRFTYLFDEVDGFIPVYVKGSAGSQAYYLPFKYQEEDEETPIICDLNGDEIPAWCGYLAKMNISKRCVVYCHVAHLPCPLEGPSLMLPLFLAYQRKIGKLPRYNHLRMLSTGEIDGNYLKSVKVEEKSGGLFANAILLAPESESPIQMPNVRILPKSLTLEKMIEKVRDLVEIDGLVSPTFREAMARLPELQSNVQYGKKNTWEETLQQVKNNMKAVNKFREPHGYLLGLMLCSAIYCHMGKTSKALELNQQAQKFAIEHNFEKELCRLEIEELVEFQDKELYGKLLQLAGPLGKNIEKLGDPDLLMRYHGTMGQAHCNATLVNLEGYSSQKAKEHFKEAIKYASQLSSEPDIAQDLNYYHYWHAVFCPGTIEEQDAYDKAKEHIKHNLSDDCKKNNWSFLKKNKLFALYRLVLQGKIPDWDCSSEDVDPHYIFWVRALMNKYLGAIATAQGHRELAKKYFDKAAEILKDSQHDILAFIYFTILAEAYRSLGDEQYKEKALDLNIIKKLGDLYPDSIEKWKAFLRRSGEFPGLTYWY